jgi:hypothetical protein
MSFSINDLEGFINGYNLRFFNVKDCPKCGAKNSFAHCLMPGADDAYNCEVCDHREIVEKKKG